MRDIIIGVETDNLSTNARIGLNDEGEFELFIAKTDGEVVCMTKPAEDMQGTVVEFLLNLPNLSAELVLRQLILGVEKEIFDAYIPIINAKLDLAAQEERDARSDTI